MAIAPDLPDLGPTTPDPWLSGAGPESTRTGPGVVLWLGLVVVGLVILAGVAVLALHIGHPAPTGGGA